MSTEPNLIMVKEADGAVYARPGLGETLKRVETEFFVFVGDDPDNAKVGVNADGIDDAAGILAAMPGASIAIRELYAGEWAIHRPKPAPEADEPEPWALDVSCPGCGAPVRVWCFDPMKGGHAIGHVHDERRERARAEAQT